MSNNYKVQLRQQAWVTVEEFDFVAKDEQDALKQAQAFVDEHKEYEPKSYELTAQAIPQPEENPNGLPDRSQDSK